MKKKFMLLTFVLIGILSTILIYSCSKQDESVCETCQQTEFVNSKVNFYQKNFAFKRYEDTQNGYVFMTSPVTTTNHLFDFYNDLSRKFDLKFDSEKIVTTILFTSNKQLNKEFDYNLDFENIDGFMSYLKNNDGSLNLKIYQKQNGKLIENKLSNSKTGGISSNDIYAISNLIFGSSKKTVFAFLDVKYTSSNKQYVYDLTEKISSAYTLNNLKLPQPSCGMPCEYGGNSQHCEVDSAFFGTFQCMNDVQCPEEKIAQKLILERILTFNYLQIGRDLRYFRDNYLKNNPGGNKVIEMYYGLGEKLPVDQMTTIQRIKTFNLIVSDILPMVYSLKNNPNSSNILINSQTNTKLVNYLLEIKQVFPDMDSKNKIDNLINKVNHFSNKSNNFVTSNLNDF